MKAKKTFLIVVVTVLCLGKVNSQTLDTPNLNLSGTQTGSNEYKAVNIQSTQTISSGTTKYIAGDEITLNPGFEVEAGAEFEAIMDDDAFHHLKILTYNLCTHVAPEYYDMHVNVINSIKPDVVAIQELAWTWNADKLIDGTGYRLEWKCTRGWNHLFIAMMWNPSLGEPINLVKERMLITQYDGYIRYHAYIIAEFQDFCFIATHIYEPDRHEIIDSILKENIVKNCINAGKPIYFAGDMNFEPNNDVVTGTLNNAGFEVLNDTTPCTVINENCIKYEYWTSHLKMLKDLVFECNTNPKRKIIERGIPFTILENLGWKFKAFDTGTNIYYHLYSADDYNSDHFPYVVKVKIK